MAIVTEQYYIGDRLFNRAYSDKGFLIHGGEPEADYSEANDPAEFGRTYVETNIPIEGGSDEADKAEAFDILTGGSE